MSDLQERFNAEAWRADSEQLARMAEKINAATPNFKSMMGSECDHAELALDQLIESHKVLLEASKAVLACDYEAIKLLKKDYKIDQELPGVSQQLADAVELAETL